MTESVKDFFEHQVESYAGNFGEPRDGNQHRFRRRLELAVELAGLCRGRMLECACGSGEITAAILAGGGIGSAVIRDISEGMLAFTRKRLEATSFGGKADFAVADVFGALGEDARKGNRYDLIVCLGLIAHTGRLGELLRLQRQCLAPGGRILLQSTLLDHPGTRLVKLLTARRYERQKGYAISYFTDGDIRRTAADGGLSVKAFRRYGVSIPFGDRISGAMNLRAEKALASWAGRSGAEGLYLLGEEGA